MDRNNTPLHKTFWFWLAIVAPILIGCDLAFAIIYFTETTSLGMSAPVINDLIAELKLPIAIAGLSIPLVAMVAAVHRSSQTAHQILVQTEQNNFANHFKHIEEFKKAISDEMLLGIWESTEEFHKTIYPQTILGDVFPLHSVYLLPVDIDEHIDASSVVSLDIEEHVDYLSHIVCRELNIPRRPFTAAQILNLIELLQKAVMFSGLHPPVRSLRKETELYLRQIHPLYEAILTIKSSPTTYLIRIINEGFISVFKFTSDYLKLTKSIQIESIVIMNALNYLASSSGNEFEGIVDQLSPDRQLEFRNCYNEYLTHFDHISHADVTNIDNLLKEFGL